MTAEPRNDAALRGASLAFGAPPVKPKPRVNDYAGGNGALAAATRAGGASRPVSRAGDTLTSSRLGDAYGQPLGYQMTGSSIASGYAGDLDRRMGYLDHRGEMGFLQPPTPPGPEKSQSPSFIAATLAASRSVSVTPNHTGQQQALAAGLRRSLGRSEGSVRSVRSVSSRGSEEQILDTRPIPPTTDLIGMFEQNGAMLQKEKRPAVERSATNATVRPASSSDRTSKRSSVRARTPSPIPTPPTTATSKPAIKSPKPSFSHLSFPKPSLPKPQAPAQKHSLPPSKPIPASKPIPIPAKFQPKQQTSPDEDASSDDSFVSASSYKPSWRATLQHQNRRLTSTSLPSTQTIHSLANAIVASSLASSRAASPSRHQPTHTNSFSLLPPPPPPTRRSTHKHLFHNNNKESRTPSPAKQGVLRTTMRKEKREEEDEGEARRRKRAHLMKKHPNKHHEGDRKRWRDVLTDRERKRYEAVWASNKGLFMPQGMESAVCNLVARDVFSRSRLGREVLEEVYALVDRGGTGGLGREEFVVGLWLVDQHLKGRKLPVRVSHSVWNSVAVMNGIKVKKFHK